jgi:glycosyltransferase involved in cell wall biosynthesis
MKKRVVFLTALLTHYRLPFHQRVRDLLAQEGVQYELIHGQPAGGDATKRDTATLTWARQVENRVFASGRLIWQPASDSLQGADLVIIGQENKLLLNYLLQLMPRSLRPRIALFGHGRNFQARDQRSLAERWKRLWATRCDWWFAYTDETRRHLEKLGFPTEKITVFNNSIDTRQLQSELSAVTNKDLVDCRTRLGIKGKQVGIFVGGLYPDKRLEFLVDAAVEVRAGVPDFELIIVGGGPSEALLRTYAQACPWIKITGPRFGSEKAAMMRLSKLFLMPGLLGLAVLDAGVASLPVVTTAYPFHSPEIAYLIDGATGLKVEAWEDPKAYAKAVIELLRDENRRASMAEAARETATNYTIEAMADRFAEGVISCLGAARHPAARSSKVST